MRKAAVGMIVVFCAAFLVGTGPVGKEQSDRAGDWTALGPPGGDIRSIIRNPKTPSELYAVTYSGIVYRSTNNGASWTRRAVIDDYVYDLAIDPKTPSTLYALAGSDIFKSVNKGVTFTRINFGNYVYCYYGRIAIHPSNPKIIYVSCAVYYDTTNWKECLAVLKSTNGGQSWTVKKLEPTSRWATAYDVVVSPKNPSLVYMCGYITPASGNYHVARIFRSTNGGETWKNVTPAFLASEMYSYIHALAVDPVNATRAYLAYTGGIARTSNSGTSWTKQTSPSWMSAYAFAIDKSAPNTVYAGAFKTLYQSKDGGANWTAISNGFYGTPSRILIQGKTFHIASGAGIFKSVNGGAKFATGHKGILAAGITGFVRLPGGAGSLTGATGTFYAAAGDYGIFKSTNAGGAWTKLLDFAGSDAIAHIVSPRSDPRRVYVSTYG